MQIAPKFANNFTWGMENFMWRGEVGSGARGEVKFICICGVDRNELKFNFGLCVKL